MAKTRTRRGARRNLTRRGGGKGNGGMAVEGSKPRNVKAKSMKHGAKGKTHTIINKKGVTRVTAHNKKKRAEAKAKKYLQKYRAALAAAAAAAAEEEEEDEDEEEEEEEEEEDDDNLDEDKFEERMAKIPPQLVSYVPNGLGNLNDLIAALEDPAVKNKNSK
jgi:NACalpha-BTF3-like transcription factor